MLSYASVSEARAAAIRQPAAQPRKRSTGPRHLQKFQVPSRYHGCGTSNMLCHVLILTAWHSTWMCIEGVQKVQNTKIRIRVGIEPQKQLVTKPLRPEGFFNLALWRITVLSSWLQGIRKAKGQQPNKAQTKSTRQGPLPGTLHVLSDAKSKPKSVKQLNKAQQKVSKELMYGPLCPLWQCKEG